ncbi:hypothetical protein RHMOL_Rhmol02G0007800 [Rhododendron molle]|uniref:Uncharacterized protein n=1 Tax=Rhododendron molle TaxID=49168 RepID=A0ACC0PLS8_RHOML|nr:hypothetical protein RHMOL_Rhmol02G0007800 [Rhododendron molle]
MLQPLHPESNLHPIVSLHQILHNSCDFFSNHHAIVVNFWSQGHVYSFRQHCCIHLLFCVERPSNQRHAMDRALQYRIPTTMGQESARGTMAQDLDLWCPGWHHQAHSFGPCQKPIW